MNSKLEEVIMTHKPTMKPQTCKQYISALVGLYKYANPKQELNLSWFKNHEEVDKAIEEKTTSVHSKRNYYASIVSILPDDAHYKEKMNDGNRLLTSVAMKNQKSDKQEENWMSYQEVREVVDKYRQLTKKLLQPSSGELSGKDLSTLSDFILLAVSSGYYIPPRRSADYANLKIRGEINKEKDNYIQGDHFVFNNYKTAGTYGKQEVKIPKELKTILNKYIKKNPHEYLLVSQTGAPLSQVLITQRLNKIFGKKISTSMLRHIYITHEYEGIDVGKLRDIAEEMGHDIETAMTYVVR